jgi:hypothetical protein
METDFSFKLLTSRKEKPFRRICGQTARFALYAALAVSHGEAE